MLQLDFVFEIIHQADRYLNQNFKNLIGLMNVEIGKIGTGENLQLLNR